MILFQHYVKLGKSSDIPQSKNISPDKKVFRRLPCRTVVRWDWLPGFLGASAGT